jgi:hypothetical protein
LGYAILRAFEQGLTFFQAIDPQRKERAAVFKLGDYVEWIEGQDPLRSAVGKIVAIIPSDTGTPQFDLYDVEFPFGKRTLYGAQLTLKESGSSE